MTNTDQRSIPPPDLWRLLGVFGSMALSTAGCTSSREAANSLYLIKPAFINVSNPNPAFKDIPPPGIPDTSVNPDTAVPYPLNIATYRLTPTSQPYLQQAVSDEAARNRLKDALVRRSNLICHYTKAHIAGNSDLINFGLGETTTILGTIGGLVTAATPARAFSGAAAFVNATRGQVDASFYQNVIQYAILQQNDKDRDTILTAINKRDPDNTKKYSVEAMLGDLENYHYHCSFYAGLEGLTKTSEYKVPSVASQVQLPPTKSDSSGSSSGNPTAGSTAMGGEH